VSTASWTPGASAGSSSGGWPSWCRRHQSASATEIATTIPAVGQVDEHAAIFTGSVRLHDGARAYYRDAKVASCRCS
jgi:hypothetical protein